MIINIKSLVGFEAPRENRVCMRRTYRIGEPIKVQIRLANGYTEHARKYDKLFFWSFNNIENP